MLFPPAHFASLAYPTMSILLADLTFRAERRKPSRLLVFPVFLTVFFRMKVAVVEAADHAGSDLHVIEPRPSTTDPATEFLFAHLSSLRCGSRIMIRSSGFFFCYRTRALEGKVPHGAPQVGIPPLLQQPPGFSL